MNLLSMARDVKDLKREVRSMRPSFSAGLLTNYTTRGVTRTPITFGAQFNANNSTAKEPRWS